MLLGTTLVLTLMTATPATSPVIYTPDETALRAYELFESPRTWKQAGMLLLEAARDLGGTHPRAVEWTVHAGRVLHAAGDSERARAAFELAAERGVAVGSVNDAAQAYLSAAAIAAASGDEDGAHKLSQKAAMLSLSPHIDESVRQSIQKRLARSATRPDRNA